MSTATPDKATKPAAKGSPVPPDEQFWKRYSPHQEMPLSAVGSFLLHTLAIGLLILLAYLGWLGFRKGDSLPVETVSFAQGGGGGKKGAAPGSGSGNGQEVIEGTQTDPKENEQPTPPDPERKLDINAFSSVPQDIKNDDTIKQLVKSGNPNLNIFSRVDKDALNKMRDGLSEGGGKGGTGKGGGKGDGDGTGEGDGRGDGKSGKLSQREKRMLRWTMIFDTRTGSDYLAQLRGLGAILAIPAGSDGKSYKVIRDLGGKGAPKLLDEDITSINRIFWIDDRPESVMSLMDALHHNGRPSHFVAFMPESLEKQLFEIELKFKGRKEEQIHETRFKVVRGQGGYRPIVVEQTGR